MAKETKVYSLRTSVENEDKIDKILNRAMKRMKLRSINATIETIILEYGKRIRYDQPHNPHSRYNYYRIPDVRE